MLSLRTKPCIASAPQVCKAVLILLAVCCAFNGRSADSLRSKFSGGLCFQKMAGFYWSNGIAVDFTSQRLAGERLHIGLNATSSSLGSALLSNALPVHMAELYAHYLFRPSRYLQPFVGWNAGFAKVNYGSDRYQNLPGSQMLLSPEAGLSYRFEIPLRVSASLGYNLFTGNGHSGLGVVYPLFFRFRVLYAIR